MSDSIQTSLTRDQVGQVLARHPANHPRTPDELVKYWVASELFDLRLIPLRAVGIATEYFAPGGSVTVGPIIVDLNVHQIGFGLLGHMPVALVLDGKHRWRDALQRGAANIWAYVGYRVWPLLEVYLTQEQDRQRKMRHMVAHYLDLSDDSPGAWKRRLECIAFPEELALIEEARKRVELGETMPNEWQTAFPLPGLFSTPGAMVPLGSGGE